jgi:hypothetical protein
VDKRRKHFREMLSEQDDAKTTMRSLFNSFKKVTKGTAAQSAFEVGGSPLLRRRNLTYRIVEAALMELRAYFPQTFGFDQFENVRR